MIERHRDDLGLARRACAGDAQARADIQGVLHRSVQAALATASASDRDEVEQRILSRLFVAEAGERCALSAYEGRASLRRWLKVIVVREHRRLHQHAGRELPFDQSASWLESSLQAASVGIDEELIRHELHAPFKDAFQRAFASLSLHERVLMRQQFGDELSIASMAKMHGKHRNSMARELAQLRARLLAGLLRRLREHTDLDDERLERLVCPQEIELSLSRLFRELPDLDAAPLPN